MRLRPGPAADRSDVAPWFEQVLRHPAVDLLGTPDAEESADERGHVHGSKTIAPGATPHPSSPGVEDPLHLALLGRIPMHAPHRLLVSATVREVRPGRGDGHEIACAVGLPVA